VEHIVAQKTIEASITVIEGADDCNGQGYGWDYIEIVFKKQEVTDWFPERHEAYKYSCTLEPLTLEERNQRNLNADSMYIKFCDGTEYNLPDSFFIFTQMRRHLRKVEAYIESKYDIDADKFQLSYEENRGMGIKFLGPCKYYMELHRKSHSFLRIEDRSEGDDPEVMNMRMSSVPKYLSFLCEDDECLEDSEMEDHETSVNFVPTTSASSCTFFWNARKDQIILHPTINIGAVHDPNRRKSFKYGKNIAGQSMFDIDLSQQNLRVNPGELYYIKLIGINQDKESIVVDGLFIPDRK